MSKKSKTIPQQPEPDPSRAAPIYAALKWLGISQIEVIYDGHSDSGCIESVAALDAERSVTDFARDRVLRGIARKRKSVVSAVEEVWIDDVMPLVAAVRQAWHELHKIAINLNQIAHHCNRHQVPPPREYQDALVLLLDLLKRLTRP